MKPKILQFSFREREREHKKQNSFAFFMCPYFIALQNIDF